MKRSIAVIVLWSMQALASDWADKAYADAKKLSLVEKYAEAASVLTDMASQRPPDREVTAMTKVAAEYERRQGWRESMATSPRAARDLIRSLLSEKGGSSLETTNVDDARVQAALTALRAKDPKSAQFFSRRKVKVVVTGDALEPVERDTLADRIVVVLRSFGLDASSTEGDETFSVPIELEPGVPVPGFSGQLKDSGLIGAGFKIPVTWTGAKKTMLLDLSLRGPGFSDLPRSFEKENWPRIPQVLGPRLFVRFDEANPL